MAKIFISYSRESLEKARSLGEILEVMKHEVWLDQALTGGQSWWNLILSEIRKCDIFLFALNPEGLDSSACKLEFNYAAELGKNILPVLISDGVLMDILPPALAQIQYVDYRHEDREAFTALAKAVNGLQLSLPLPDPLPEPPPAPMSYLGGLREQVDSTKLLSFEEQTGLVFRLRDALREAKDPDEVRALVARFRSRDDLLARVADEIDLLLGTYSVSAPRANATSPASRNNDVGRVDIGQNSPEKDVPTLQPLPRRNAAWTFLQNLSEVLSFKQVWISLVAGALISVVLDTTKEFRWLPPRLWQMRLSWALPSATLLFITVLWKKLEWQGFNTRIVITFLLVVGFAIPCYPRLRLDPTRFPPDLISRTNYEYFPSFWTFDWEAGMAGAALSLLFALGVFWNDDPVQPIPYKSAITSLGAGIGCLFFVYLNRYWYYVVIQFLEYIFAAVFVACFLFIAAKKYTSLQKRSANP